MYKTLVTAAIAMTMLGGGSAAASDVRLMDPDVSYSATRVIEAGGQRLEQRYYHQSVGKNRADSELKGEKSSMILRLDRNLVWMVAPKQGMYMEMPLQDPQARKRVFDVPDDDRITEFELVGQEAVNGVSAGKYRVSSRDAQGDTVQGFLWISDDDRILVKMDMSEGRSRAVMELKDLRVGPQPESLFEPPAGYRKMAFAGLDGMLGGMTGKTPVAPAADSAAKDAATGQADDGQPGFVEDIATEAANEAEQTTKDEVRNTVRENVRDGLRKIFGR